jgi:hypothetical protein
MTGHIDDIPDPGIDELQQRPPELWAPPNIPVTIEGTPRVLIVGNRAGSPFAMNLTTAPQHVLGEEPNRAAVTLIGSAAWNYRSTSNAQDVPVPANVPLVLHHTLRMFANAGGACTLSVFPEYHGD